MTRIRQTVIRPFIDLEPDSQGKIVLVASTSVMENCLVVLQRSAIGYLFFLFCSTHRIEVEDGSNGTNLELAPLGS